MFQVNTPGLCLYTYQPLAENEGLPLRQASKGWIRIHTHQESKRLFDWVKFVEVAR